MNNNEQNGDCNNQYDEISLKEIIEILINKKKMIGLITGVCVIVGMIMSFVVITPQYNSTNTISVTPTIGNVSNISDVEGLIESFSQLPIMTVESYKEQVKSQEVLDETIKSLDLRDEAGEYISIESLSNKVSVSIVSGTNLINITTKDSDPEMASKISNSIGENFIEFISEKTRNRGAKSAELIEAQLEIEEQNLDDKSKLLTDYISDNQSVDELKAQKDSLISQITSYKSDLNSVQKSIMTEQAALEVLLGEDYDESSEDIDLNMDIKGEISENIKLDIADSAGLQDALLTVKVTNLETALVENIANEKSLETKISDMEERLKIAQTDLAEQEHVYNSILRDYNLAKTTYDAYQDRHKEAMITAASDVGQTSVVVSSSAIPHESPISPNKTMILAISLILGLMIGVLLALFSDYWKKA